MILSRSATDSPRRGRKLKALSVIVVAILTASVGVSVAANSPTVTTELQSVLRINSGGGSFGDLQGQAWTADTGATGGEAKTTDQLINGAWDQKLFQTQRVGMTAYKLDAPAGGYELRMYFAAFDDKGAPFSVTAGTAPLLNDVNIASEVGVLTAEVKQVHVEVPAGGLVLNFTGASAAVSGFELLQAKKVATAAESTTPALTKVAATSSAFAVPATGPFGETPTDDWITETQLGGGAATAPGAGAAAGVGTGATTPDPFGAPADDWISEEQLGGGAATPAATGTAGTPATDPFGTAPSEDWVSEEELSGMAAPTATGTNTAPTTDPFVTPGDDVVTEDTLGGTQMPRTTPSSTSSDTGSTTTANSGTAAAATSTGTPKAVRKAAPLVGTSAYRMRGVGVSGVDPDGHTWRADTGTGGALMEMPVGGNPIFNGVRAGAQAYHLPVLNGPYTLELSMGMASKGFSARVEGQEVITNFSEVMTETTTMTVAVVIKDGVLDIEFVGGNADVAGIELMMADTGMTTTDDTTTATSTGVGVKTPTTSVTVGTAAPAGASTTPAAPMPSASATAMPSTHAPGTPAHGH